MTKLSSLKGRHMVVVIKACVRVREGMKNRKMAGVAAIAAQKVAVIALLGQRRSFLK